MAGTSVTGRGQGAANANKGPLNARTASVPLLTPHIVAAGQAVLEAGLFSTASITVKTYIPNVVEPASQYNVICIADNGEIYGCVKSNNGSGVFSSVLFGAPGAAAGAIVNWIITTKGPKTVGV